MSKETFRRWLDKQSSTIDLSVLITAQDRHGVNVALPEGCWDATAPTHLSDSSDAPPEEESEECYESVGGIEPTVKKDGRTQRTGHACTDSQPPRVRKITIRYSVWTDQ